MARIDPIPIDQAQGKARELLDELVARGREPGPMVRAIAVAPALLRGYLDLTRAMKRSHIDRRVTERINLAVPECLGRARVAAAAAWRLNVSPAYTRRRRRSTS